MIFPPSETQDLKQCVETIKLSSRPQEVSFSEAVFPLLPFPSLPLPFISVFCVCIPPPPNKLIMHYDKASSDTALSVKEFLEKKFIVVQEHHAYSSNQLHVNSSFSLP